MLPAFAPSGELPPGIHWTEWREFVERFGDTAHRLRLIRGLQAALASFRRAGCRTLYVDGSFVTTKRIPRDYDVCWEEENVDPTRLDPILLRFESRRAAQKLKFLGEFFPASWDADGAGSSFLEFFQTSKESGRPKGIVAFNPQEVR